MATLEKIRSKSVLLIVIIGLALLAFIVGDALTNSRNIFGDRTTVAKVNGEKIDYTEYQRKMEELNSQLEEMRRQNPQQAAQFDTQLLSQIALNQLIDEKLIDAGADRLGIRVSGDQLRHYMIEEPLNPKVQQLVQQLQQAGLLQVKEGSMPNQIYAQAYSVIFNPKQNGLTQQQVEPYQKYWVSLEEETKKLVRRNTYQRLVFESVVANDLDKRNLYNDYVATSVVEFAYKPLGNVDEKKYPVSDADLQAEYDRVKGRDYRVEQPTKAISFISVDVAPSQADQKASKALAAQTLKSFTDSTSNGTLSKEAKKEGVNLQRMRLRLQDLPKGNIADWVTNASAGQAAIVTENIQGFTILKKGATTSQIDSIQLNVVQVVGANLPAKVLARLNAGLSADSLATAFPADSVMAQTKQWIPLFNAQGETQALTAEMRDSLINAGTGRYIILDQQQEGAILATVTEKKAPVQIVEYDEITYDLKPSAATLAAAQQKLEKFINENNTAEAFSKNAAKAGYTLRNFNISADDPAVPYQPGLQRYFPDSRQVVRWVVVDGKPGNVSRIYESKDPMNPKFYVAAIDAEFDEYVPLKSVKEELTTNVRRQKAVADLEKQYTGKGNVAQTAAAMGVAPQTNEQFRYALTPGIRDSKVVGRIAGSKPGKVYVVKGDDGVYVYTVKSSKVEKFPYDAENYSRQYMQQVNPDLSKMLRGAHKVKNNIYKFEAGD